jgi:hypothetical protein
MSHCRTKRRLTNPSRALTNPSRSRPRACAQGTPSSWTATVPMEAVAHSFWLPIASRAGGGARPWVQADGSDGYIAVAGTVPMVHRGRCCGEPRSDLGSEGGARGAHGVCGKAVAGAGRGRRHGLGGGTGWPGTRCATVVGRGCNRSQSGKNGQIGPVSAPLSGSGRTLLRRPSGCPCFGCLRWSRGESTIHHPDGNPSWLAGVVRVRSGVAGWFSRTRPDNSIGGDRFRLRWSNQGKRAEGCGCDLVNPVTANQ